MVPRRAPWSPAREALEPRQRYMPARLRDERRPATSRKRPHAGVHDGKAKSDGSMARLRLDRSMSETGNFLRSAEVSTTPLRRQNRDRLSQATQVPNDSAEKQRPYSGRRVKHPDLRAFQTGHSPADRKNRCAGGSRSTE